MKKICTTPNFSVLAVSNTSISQSSHSWLCHKSGVDTSIKVFDFLFAEAVVPSRPPLPAPRHPPPKAPSIRWGHMVCGVSRDLPRGKWPRPALYGREVTLHVVKGLGDTEGAVLHVHELRHQVEPLQREAAEVARNHGLLLRGGAKPHLA